jgi:hypothetical protein
MNRNYKGPLRGGEKVMDRSFKRPLGGGGKVGRGVWPSKLSKSRGCRARP